MRIIELEIAIAEKVVNRIENIGLGLRALVAGGAPRSWYLGESCNDIDVYVQVGGQDDVREAIPVIEHALKANLAPLRDYKPGEGVLLRCLTTRVDGKEVQIMFVNLPPEEYVYNCFGYSISKFIYRDGEINVSWEAELSLRHNVVVTPYPDIRCKYKEKLINKFGCLFVKDWNAFLNLIDAPQELVGGRDLFIFDGLD